MSLKAKIEAVIYASEEPVTLVQLAGLLGEEAQGELDALAARQQQLHLAGADAEAAGETRWRMGTSWLRRLSEVTLPTITAMKPR